MEINGKKFEEFDIDKFIKFLSSDNIIHRHYIDVNCIFDDTNIEIDRHKCYIKYIIIKNKLILVIKRYICIFSTKNEFAIIITTLKKLNEKIKLSDELKKCIKLMQNKYFMVDINNNIILLKLLQQESKNHIYRINDIKKLYFTYLLHDVINKKN